MNDGKREVRLVVNMPAEVVLALQQFALAEGVGESKVLEAILRAFFGELAPDERRAFVHKWIA